MRILPNISLLLLGASTLWGQNAAPTQQNVPANVPAATEHAATNEATKARSAETESKNGVPAPEGQEKVLDSVVAIVNGDVLLESDVQQEQRLESLQLLPPGENTTVRAAQHLITRTLIEQQMKAQQASPAEISDAEVAKTIDQIRKTLPECAAADCESSSGWARFLAARGMTPEEVDASWRQRLTILDYLNLRFRSGVRIPKADIAKYYQTSLVPEFQKRHQPPPPLKSLSDRIQEILLQQQVSKQIDDWEQTLRQQGSVQILVPAYGPSTNNDDETGSGA